MLGTPPRSRDAQHASPFRRWLDQRTGLDALLRVALHEPIPGGARWAYVFGSGLLLLSLSQVLTGIALALYYVPAANDAHVTVAYIVKVVSGGAFLRSLHAYGASAFIVLLVLHIAQTFLYGSYKGRRELVWLAGCALFALVLGMAFTGYLLPWDQRAYFATAVGTSVMGEVPVVGNLLKLLLRGGNDLGTVTLSRFFVLHVFVLPAFLVALTVAHVYLFRKAGPAGPIAEHPLEPRLATESFYPRQFALDVIFATLLVAVLALLAYWAPVQLGPEANPADAAFIPRPEWYFLPAFEWLKLWPGNSAVIGVVLLPAVVTFLFVAAPFLDRGFERHPLCRPLAIGGFCVVLVGLVGFGVLSGLQDRRDPVVATQMARQAMAERLFMARPFAPLETGSVAAPAPPAVAATQATAPGSAAPATASPSRTAVSSPHPAAAFAPKPNSAPVAVPSSAGDTRTPSSAASRAAPAGDVAQGRAAFVYFKCTDCHGENGEGTNMAPSLVMLGPEWTADQVSQFLQNPSETAQDLGMPVTPATSPDLAPLVAYVLSLRQ